MGDDDGRDGFTKWPFMTSHTWAEYPIGKWTLEVRFVGDRPNTGYLKEWTLMLHGTREAPYSELPVTDPHSTCHRQESPRRQKENVNMIDAGKSTIHPKRAERFCSMYLTAKRYTSTRKIATLRAERLTYKGNLTTSC